MTQTLRAPQRLPPPSGTALISTHAAQVILTSAAGRLQTARAELLRGAAGGPSVLARLARAYLNNSETEKAIRRISALRIRHADPNLLEASLLRFTLTLNEANDPRTLDPYARAHLIVLAAQSLEDALRKHQLIR